MSALSIQPTYPIFTDIDGQPLESGYIWIGTVNLNPITNPINVYWDAALTQPAVQPIRTVSGYPSNAGTPARLYVNSDYSIQVQNKNATVVYSAPQATERISGDVISAINANKIVYDPAGSGAVSTNVQTKLRQTVSVFDFMTAAQIADVVAGTSLVDVTAAIQDAVDASTDPSVVNFPDGKYLVTNTITITNPVLLNLGNAVIDFAPSSNVVCFEFQGSVGASTTLTSNAAKNSSSLAVTNPAGFAAGDWVQITSTAVAYPGGRPQDTCRQMALIASVVGNTINLSDTNLLLTFNTPDSAAVTKQNFLTSCGVQGGTIIARTFGFGIYGVRFVKCNDFYIKNSNIESFRTSCIDLVDCVNGVVEGNRTRIESIAAGLEYGLTVYASQFISVIGNQMNSLRTGIDLTELSAFVTVSGNTCYRGGIATHTTHYCNISDNTIYGAGILIRGPYQSIENNTVYNNNSFTFETQEAGESNIHVKNNYFYGFIGLKLFNDNCSFVGNTCLATNYVSYSGTSSLIRIENSSNVGNLIIANNHLEYIGTGTRPVHGIHGSFGSTVQKDWLITGNIVKNVDVGIDAGATGDNPASRNITVSNNIVWAHVTGISFRLADNTQITGNTIYGQSTMTEGILRIFINSTTDDGLIISDNIIENATYGIRSRGNGTITNVLLNNNIFKSIVTANLDGTGTWTQLYDALRLRSPDGTTWTIVVDNAGVLSAV
jgi:hypothetical protein